ncbi:MAG: rRNA maturation RNase YbeY [Planctomycetota bacterium]
MIEIANEQVVLAFDPAAFERDVTALATEAGWAGTLSIAVVDDATIATINEQFLDHEGPTDVIAFPLEEDQGEVVVSAERALAEAKARGVEPMAELLLYVVHGILHLMGHDDHDRSDAERMHSLSLKHLQAIGYRNTIPPEERGGKPGS